MMKGLDLHREFFEECGKLLLMRAFPDEFPQLAITSVGWGSGRLGADDEYSRDHCWEPGFQIFSDRLSWDVLKGIRAYASENLPWEFKGFTRSDCPGSPNTIRAWAVDEFFSFATSFAYPPAQDRQWLLITDKALYHATNGEVFHDPTGDLTKRRRETMDIRRRLSLYNDIVNLCAGYIYDNGLASRGQYWWADLRQTITGDLKDFPLPNWIGVEYKYASQCALGDFRKLLSVDG